MSKKTLVFTTLFDSTYLLQGLTLVDSIFANYPESRIYLAPLDDLSGKEAMRRYRNNDRVIFDEGLIRENYEAGERNCKNRGEVIFSLKPLLLSKAMNRVDALKFFYCDADLYFFNRFEFGEIQEEVFLSEHIFAPRQSSHSINGKYNAGLVGFSKSPEAIRCLDWWTLKCKESTRHDPQNGIVGDQKYLEHFSELTSSIRIVRSSSVNQSVWMLDNNTNVGSGPTFDGQFVSSYHFHRVRPFKLIAKTGINQYGKLSCTKDLFNFVYKPYLAKLSENRKLMANDGLKKPSFKLIDLKPFEWARI